MCPRERERGPVFSASLPFQQIFLLLFLPFGTRWLATTVILKTKTKLVSCLSKLRDFYYEELNRIRVYRDPLLANACFTIIALFIISQSQ